MSGSSVGGPTLKDAAKLESRLRGSASWFNWIAILATIHGGAIAFKLGDVSFIGLGVTRLMDQTGRVLLGNLGATSPLSLSIFSMTGTLVVSGIFFASGYLGIRRHLWFFYYRNMPLRPGHVGLYNDDGLYPVDLACRSDHCPVAWPWDDH